MKFPQCVALSQLWKRVNFEILKLFCCWDIQTVINSPKQENEGDGMKSCILSIQNLFLFRTVGLPEEEMYGWKKEY
jgi:hypothetical protein